MVNHFPNINLLTTKIGLLESLRTYDRTHRSAPPSPLTIYGNEWSVCPPQAQHENGVLCTPHLPHGRPCREGRLPQELQR